VNGVQVLSKGGKLPTITGCQTNGNIGRGYNDNTFFTGDVAEVLVYTRAITPSERQAVDQYLAGKYGLPAPFPPLLPVYRRLEPLP
jgi:hypothetical protein